MIDPEILRELDQFDLEEHDNNSPVGTRIRHEGASRVCVEFSSLVCGQRFYTEPRSDDYLTRSERPLSACRRSLRETFVWVETR